ncbi:MAG: hypothetical protein ACRDQB_00815 [Thermocrispum sp.]
MVERDAKVSLGGPTEGLDNGQYLHGRDLSGTIEGFSGKREQTTGRVQAMKPSDDNATWCLTLAMFSPK